MASCKFVSWHLFASFYMFCLKNAVAFLSKYPLSQVSLHLDRSEPTYFGLMGFFFCWLMWEENQVLKCHNFPLFGIIKFICNRAGKAVKLHPFDLNFQFLFCQCILLVSDVNISSLWMGKLKASVVLCLSFACSFEKASYFVKIRVMHLFMGKLILV